MKIVVIGLTGLIGSKLIARSRRSAMDEIQVSVASPEAADYGVAELSAAGEQSATRSSKTAT